MFEEPPTKRAHIVSPVNYGFEYDIIDTITSSNQQSNISVATEKHATPLAQTTDDSGKDEVEDEGLEFRLFSVPSKSNAVNPTVTSTTQALPTSSATRVHKIRIRSPTPLDTAGDGAGGFINPHRHRGYYFTFSPTNDWDKEFEIIDVRKAQFTDVAVSGPDIQVLAQTKWPGTSLPFRVLHIPISQCKVPRPSSTTTTTENKLHSRRRPRLCKKRRILLRMKLQASKEAERSEKEKKTKRNREKKVKKRLRDKEKAAAAAATIAGSRSTEENPETPTEANIMEDRERKRIEEP
ncbi:hypothetical protein UCRPC4_g04165 [Phaeomoniella chlamydospora]|uniref:Uncharacterized protein n=1 Tax=Phaeomoniella chlamydospora TaxID=158046 RepID=A0A0G2G9X0_PHACM|nr:hypothetical protein UCRPC4_g04165 [Phaeomoniella chlamydospora]